MYGYRKRNFEDYNLKGSKAENELRRVFALRGYVLIRNPRHKREPDFVEHTGEFYVEAKARFEHPDEEFIEKHLKGYTYPIVLDCGKMFKYTQFLKDNQATSLMVLRLEYKKEWRHLNGWYKQDLKKVVDLYNKDKQMQRGMFKRELRNDEKETGKTNRWKWHIELENFDKFADLYDG